MITPPSSPILTPVSTDRKRRRKRLILECKAFLAKLDELFFQEARNTVNKSEKTENGKSRTPQAKKNRKEEGRVNQGFRAEAEGKSQEYRAPPISTVKCAELNNDNLSVSSLRLEETFQEEPLSQRRSPDGCEGRVSVEEIAVSRESDSPPLKSFSDNAITAIPATIPFSPDTSLSYTLPEILSESSENDSRFISSSASPIEYSNHSSCVLPVPCGEDLSDSQTDIPLPLIADYVHFDVDIHEEIEVAQSESQLNVSPTESTDNHTEVRDYNVFDVQVALNDSINRALEIRKMKLDENVDEVTVDDDNNDDDGDNNKNFWEKPADGIALPHFLDHNVEFIEENWEDSFWEDVDSTKPSLPVVPQQEDEISQVICEAVDLLWSFRRCGMSWDEAKPTDKYLQNDSFKLFIYDLCREVLTDLFFEEDNTIPSYQKRPCPLTKRDPPNQLTLVRPIVVDKVLNLLNTQKRIENCASKSGRLDNVDTLLSMELVEEEADWTNYDNDECEVKMQVADQLFELLLKDSIRL
ncbi:DgyrCDS2006 [Dimorphilus gyrociliatus]|uniref:DgyrCDS2006 n=1 Tax=Dimorphilus gyrociliatus TaxID=2664684 RepID=A0A7I8V978_9ANNE|nr:DgyrCDS2006 [Dimorphilus gyrociliatus]